MGVLQLLVIGSQGESKQVPLLDSPEVNVLPARDWNEAREGISLQRFDAILVGSDMAQDALAVFVQHVRDLERSWKVPGRTPVLVLASNASTDQSTASTLPASSGPDATLGEDLDFEALRETIRRIASSSESPAAGSASQALEVPILFDSEKFQSELGDDVSLIIEIIDLFFAESSHQVADLSGALRDGDFERIGRVAHTVKGSLGSLQAPLPRSVAQDLELAAKAQNRAECETILKKLESAIDDLNPALLRLKSELQ